VAISQAVCDIADPRLDDYRDLTDAQLRRQVGNGAAGRGSGTFIVEGVFALERLIVSTYPIRSVLLSSQRAPGLLAGPLARLDVPVLVADRALLAAVAGFDVHRGVLACADRLELPRPDELFGRARRVMLLEGITDNENLGALFRNASAFGVDAVGLDPTCADPLYRRSIRVSVGHVLRLAYSRLIPWPHSLHVLKDNGFTLAALTPSPSGASIDEADVVERLRAGKLALLLGGEGPGLSQAALQMADLRVRIPMSGGVDSLNVATAAAVALFAVFAGRRTA
jgi:tRNA G18 (ribose-2'-O)-methylase SpoU